MYGSFVSDYVLNGAQFIAIITNDGWWGNTEGHRQHAMYASLRAIENRRSIARSANTGISCVINQRGEILQQTKFWERDGIRAEVNLNDKITFYAKQGDYLAMAAMSIAALLGLLLLLKKKI